MALWLFSNSRNNEVTLIIILRINAAKFEKSENENIVQQTSAIKNAVLVHIYLKYDTSIYCFVGKLDLMNRVIGRGAVGERNPFTQQYFQQNSGMQLLRYYPYTTSTYDITRDRSIPRSLQMWVSNEILDLTADLFS